MTDPIPAEAVEAAARALCELDGGNPDSRATEWVDGHWTTRASDPAWTYYTVEAHAALTAAAPHISAQERTTAGAMTELFKAEHEKNRDLRAGIEALRDVTRINRETQASNRDAMLRDGDSTLAEYCKGRVFSYDAVLDALDALLRGAANV